MKNKKIFWSLSFLILLIIGTFYVLFKNHEISDIYCVVLDANVWYLLLALFLSIMFLVFGGIYLKIILKSLNVKTTLRKCFVYRNIDCYFASITPSSSGGEPAAMYYMSKDGVSPLISAQAILLITALYKIVVIVLGILSFIITPNLLKGNGLAFELAFSFGLIINIVIVVLCFFLIFSTKNAQKLMYFLINIGSKLRIIKNKDKMIEKVDRKLIEYTNSAAYIKDHKSLSFKVLGLMFLQRISLFLVSYCVYKSLNLSGFNIIEFIMLQVAITLSVDFLPLPGGVGVSEALFLLLYSKIYSSVTLVPAMLLTRGINYYFLIVFTGIIVILNHIRILKQTKLKKSK